MKSYLVALIKEPASFVVVQAFSKRNARLSGSRKLGVKPAAVFVKDNGQ